MSFGPVLSEQQQPNLVSLAWIPPSVLRSWVTKLKFKHFKNWDVSSTAHQLARREPETFLGALTNTFKTRSSARALLTEWWNALLTRWCSRRDWTDHPAVWREPGSSKKPTREKAFIKKFDYAVAAAALRKTGREFICKKTTFPSLYIHFSSFHSRFC